MKIYKAWLLSAIKRIDRLYDHPMPEATWEEAAAIAHEAGDRAAVLGLSHLHEASRQFSGMADAQEVKTFLSLCLGSLKQGSAPGDLLSVEAAAKRLSIGIRTAYRLVDDGLLRHIRVGQGRGTIRIRPVDLEKFMQTSVPRW